jgi:hypothetical protein
MFPCNSAAIPLRVPLQFRCLATQRNAARNLHNFNSLLIPDSGFVPAESPFLQGFFLWTRQISAAQRKSTCEKRYRRGQNQIGEDRGLAITALSKRPISAGRVLVGSVRLQSQTGCAAANVGGEV